MTFQDMLTLAHLTRSINGTLSTICVYELPKPGSRNSQVYQYVAYADHPRDTQVRHPHGLIFGINTAWEDGISLPPSAQRGDIVHARLIYGAADSACR